MREENYEKVGKSEKREEDDGRSKLAQIGGKKAKP